MLCKARMGFTAIFILLAAIGSPLWAAEIITAADVDKEIVTREVLVKTADNAVFLVDTSSSMSPVSKKYRPETKYALEKQSLVEALNRLPDLGFNVGIYDFTPWKAIYPLQSFDRAKAAASLDRLPQEASGRTPLVEAFDRLESLLKGVSGKSVVYIFSDGGYDRAIASRAPGDRAAELAARYDVCFQIIDHAGAPEGRKTVRDMGKASPCSRVIAFDSYITNPYYALSPLYYAKADTDVVTVVEEKVVGIKIDNILFDHDKAELSPEAQAELNELGKFLKSHPDATAYFVGYTDSTGTQDYNLALSRRRTAAAISYVMENFAVDPVRLVGAWYGEANPVMPNTTEEGRAANRRVEIVVGG